MHAPSSGQCLWNRNEESDLENKIGMYKLRGSLGKAWSHSGNLTAVAARALAGVAVALFYTGLY